MKQKHSRRAAVLILAACLAAALAVTAYATGAIQSLIAKYWGNITYQTPDDRLRTQRPDYASWLDDQLETQAMMLDIGAQAVPTEVDYQLPGLEDAGVTLLEYYYDGEKIALACRFRGPDSQVDFDVSGNANFPYQTVAAGGYPSYRDIVKNEEDLRAIEEKLKSEGSVCFLAVDTFISDHVYANDQDLGPCIGDMDENGIFLIDPIFMGSGKVELPESCRNLPEVTVQLTYRALVYAYQLEGDTVRYARVGQADFPVSFTIPNLDPESIPARWSLAEEALSGGELHLTEQIRGTTITIDSTLPMVNTEALSSVTLAEDAEAWKAMGREVVMERFPQIEDQLDSGSRDISLSEEGTGNLLLSFDLSQDGLAGYVGYLDVARDLNGTNLDGEDAVFQPYYITTHFPEGTKMMAEDACRKVIELLENYSCFRFIPWNVRAEYDWSEQQGCYRITLQPEYQGLPVYGQRANTEAFYTKDGIFLCRGLLALKEDRRTEVQDPLSLEQAIERFVNTIPDLTSDPQVQCTAIRLGYLALIGAEEVTLSPAWVFECQSSGRGSTDYFQIPILMENGKICTTQNGQQILVDPA